MTRKSTVRGFTLVELLVTVAILVVLVGAVGYVLQAAHQTVVAGSDRMQTDRMARTALERMGRDVEQAIADPLLSLRLSFAGGPSAYGFTNSDFRFVTTAPATAGDAGRDGALCGYRVRATARDPNRFELVRAVRGIPAADTADSANAYFNTNWCADVAWRAEDETPVAANVAAFWVAIHAPSGEVWEASSSVADGWQPSVDVYLELLDERDARALSDWRRREPAADVGEWIDRRVRRYTARLEFANRDGYRDRGVTP